MTIILWEEQQTSWFLRFDALRVEDIHRDAEVSMYPIETGATLSDHYRPLPREISLEGIVSDTPSGIWTNIFGDLELTEVAPQPTMTSSPPLILDYRPDARGPRGAIRPISTSILPSQRLIRANVEQATGRLPQKATVLQLAPGQSANRIEVFLDMIDRLMEYRLPVSVLLETGVEYDNMMITTHRAIRESGSGGAVTMTIDLQEVNTADPTETVKGSGVGVKKPDDTKHAPLKDKGNTGPKEPTAEEQALLNDVYPSSAGIVRPSP